MFGVLITYEGNEDERDFLDLNLNYFLFVFCLFTSS